MPVSAIRRSWTPARPNLHAAPRSSIHPHIATISIFLLPSDGGIFLAVLIYEDIDTTVNGLAFSAPVDPDGVHIVVERYAMSTFEVDLAALRAFALVVFVVGNPLIDLGLDG